MLISENQRFRDTEITYKSLLYRGRSVGSEETCHQFPGYGLCFDIGAAPLSSTTISNVFLTHGHNDHAGGIIRHFLRRQSWGLPGAVYHVPTWLMDPVRAYFKAQGAMGYGIYNVPRSLMLTPLTEASKYEMGNDRFVTPFPVVHRVPCFGYALGSRRRRLKSEFASLSQEEIKNLVKSGQTVNEPYDAIEAAFCGDTSIELIHDAPSEVKTAKFLILECSFLDDSVPLNEVKAKGHIHISEIRKALEKGLFDGNDRVLLTHFSARYSPREIAQAVIDLPEKFIPLI